MKIELKAIKYAAFASQETNCYSANLYVDGKKIGTVKNEGHGGCDSFHGDKEAFKRADDWCKANLPKWGLRGEKTYETDLEMHCANMLNEFLDARELKQKFRTAVLFQDPKSGYIYGVKHNDDIPATIATILKESPNSVILNTMPIKEAVKLIA